MRITNELRLILSPFSFHPTLSARIGADAFVLPARRCKRRVLRLVRPGYSYVNLTALVLLALSVIVPGFANGQSSEQELERSFRAGQAALRQGDFLRATEEFKKVLTLEPNL